MDTVGSNTRFEIDVYDSQLVVRLAGDWTLEQGLVDFRSTVRDAESSARRLSFDAARLGDWDSSLISYLLEAHRWADEKSVEFDVASLPGTVTQLLELATAVPPHDTGDKGKRRSLLERVGTGYLEVRRGFIGQLSFVGQVTVSLGRLLIARSDMRIRDFWMVVEDHGPKALPIVSLISFLVGLIVAFLGSVVLTQFGAGIYNAHLVGYGMLRELGALMTGIIMVGRSGAAFAAEIGAMKASEEIDAYETLGVSPIDFIVMPRMMALFVMMPLLTVISDVVGVAGGMLVSATLMDIAPRLFLGNLFDAVGLPDFGIGVLKGTVFGALIAISGCLRGLQSGKSADAVGKATTSAVVTGITLIIGANAVIDWLASIV